MGGWVCEPLEASPGAQRASTAFWVGWGFSRVSLQGGACMSLPSEEGPWRARLHLLEHSWVRSGPWGGGPASPPVGGVGL